MDGLTYKQAAITFVCFFTLGATFYRHPFETLAIIAAFIVCMRFV